MTTSPSEQVRIAVEDPASDDARFCLRSYFAELDTRFEAGYREVAAFNQEPYAHHWFEKRLS